MNKRKVLFICSDDYPFLGANGRLLNNLFGAGLKDPYEIHVLTYIHSLTEKEEETIDGVVVHRFFSWFMLPKKEAVKLLQISGKHKLFFKLFLKKFIPKIASKLDPTFFLSEQYSRDIFNKIKELDEKLSFDVLVPVLAGYENVEASIRYKKKRPGIVLVVYQMDPCKDNMMEKSLSRKKREMLEMQFLKEADAIFTTPIINKSYRNEYKESITNKVIQLEFPAVVRSDYKVRKCGEKTYCLFCGNIYKKIRDPHYTIILFKALREDNVELHIVGNCDEYLEDGKGENIIFHGSVPNEEGKQYMERADILVNIGNVMNNQVPSKIFDYLSTGKPIVNIYKNSDCPTLSYLKKYPYACSIREKEKLDFEDVETLKRFIISNRGKRLDNATVREIYNECTPEKCSIIITNTIDKLLNVLNKE